MRTQNTTTGAGTSAAHDTVNCPKCGGRATAEYCPPYQEYAGASVQDGYTYISCACGHEDTIDADLSDFNWRENTRGW